MIGQENIKTIVKWMKKGWKEREKEREIGNRENKI